MRIKAISKQSIAKQDIIHILVLVTITLCIGIYLICTAAVIAKDGVTFIEYAKDFEINPTETMIQQDQHPGYPFMILSVHKIVSFFNRSDSIYSWIYCAQGISFFFRLLSLAVLFFIGKEIVGAAGSFCALLIFIFLPKPAAFGSDALSDWPHLFFLSAGFLCLLKGAKRRKVCWFWLASLMAGIGYLVRPECIQIIIYGFLWLVFELRRPRKGMSRTKAVTALILMAGCFVLIVGPYMKMKGNVFPKKKLVSLQFKTKSHNLPAAGNKSSEERLFLGNVLKSKSVKGAMELFNNFGDTFMWFFLPFLLVGTWKYLRRLNFHEPIYFLVFVFGGLNICLMIWLYLRAGYMNVRHTMPFAAIAAFFVPLGLEGAAWFLCKSSSGKKTQDQPQRSFRLFIILTATGIAICLPKLLRPLHHDKQVYSLAAKWLANNTEKNSIVAVPDVRIGFLAERTAVVSAGKAVPGGANYVVKVSGKDEMIEEGEILFSACRKGRKIIIYKPCR